METMNPSLHESHFERDQVLFNAEESEWLFGFDGALIDAFQIGDQRFGVFDTSVNKAPYIDQGRVISDKCSAVIVQFNLDGYIDDQAYKGLRANESAVLGRAHLNHRFNYDTFVSASHVSVTQDEEGLISIKDLGSTNGTSQLSREDLVGERFGRSTATKEVEELREYAEFNPMHRLVIDDTEYRVSAIIDGRHKKAILYALDSQDQIVARFLYKSKTDGGWRAASGYNSEGKIFSKGQGEHYTQETKLHPDIVGCLEATQYFCRDDDKVLDRRIKDIFGAGYAELIDNFARESTIHRIAGFEKVLSALEPGRLKRTKMDEADAYNTLEEINRALALHKNSVNDIMPDFSKGPLLVGHHNHTILGPTVHRHFAATINNRAAVWAFARDAKGRTWVDSIKYADVGTTTYGTPAEVIDSGILTSKPLDQEEQVNALREADRVPFYDGSRVTDITSYLARLLPIKDFKYWVERNEAPETTCEASS